MKNKRYWKSLDASEKQALADAIGVRKDYLSNVINNNTGYSASMAKRIASNSGGKITLKFLIDNLLNKD